MKCKRIIKVVGALALTLALLVSSGVVSFAADYTTTTKYIDEDTIEVTSVATGLNNGDKATYVAYNNGSFSEANAVYIDQATAGADGSVTFDYQTSSDNVKATVKFGGSTVNAAQNATIEGYTIPVYVDGEFQSNQVVATVDANYTGQYLAREFDVTIAPGKVVSNVQFNFEDVDVWYVKNGKVVVYSNVIKEGGLSLDIYTTDAASTGVKLGTVKGGAGKITAFATATCADAADYGILVGTGAVALNGAKAWNEAEDYTTAVKLPALGKGADGGFCVEVEDSALSAGNYNVAAYAGTTVSSVKVATVE